MNLKDEYIKFFVSKGHVAIPSAPLVPENDSSVLFNTAGMQPLIPYLMGQEHPKGTRLCDYQKCVRTNDLDNIGDSYHHTFFEMLGNWSLGDYFKDEAISWSFTFLTEVLKFPKERLAVTIYQGNGKIPKDEVTYNKWVSLGIDPKHIAQTEKDNFWEVEGGEGPCGPDTEMFYFRSEDPIPEVFDPEDSRWVEIWNDVFTEYYKDGSGNVTTLPKKNVDTGMGVERVTAILEGKDDNYESSIWKPVIKKIEELASLSYEDDNNKKAMRIIADHLRAAVFIGADNAGIVPSNTDRGYILRRLIRRAIRYARKLNIDLESPFEREIAQVILDEYKIYYAELNDNYNKVLDMLSDEKKKFVRTLDKGLKEFNKIGNNDIDGLTAFHLYDTYGFPIELTEELAREKNIKVDIDGFNKHFKEHQELSRTASAGMFKGGLAGNSEIQTRYHTATHLLNAALRQVIGSEVHQHGSNINDERMRFDFSCDHKLTDEEKTAVEALVNKWINEGYDVICTTMKKEEALKSGAECMFPEKYPDMVTVYSIGDFSKELCGGPHVKNTSLVGEFHIVKEESSSAGIRRIKAIIK